MRSAAQASGALGMFLVPVGVAWLLYELRKKGRQRPGHRFALMAVLIGSFVALAIVGIGLAMVGRSLALLALALYVVIVTKLRPCLR